MTRSLESRRKRAIPQIAANLEKRGSGKPRITSPDLGFDASTSPVSAAQANALRHRSHGVPSCYSSYGWPLLALDTLKIVPSAGGLHRFGTPDVIAQKHGPSEPKL